VKTYERVEAVYAFLTWSLGGSGQIPGPATLPLRERTLGVHWIRCWVGPLAGLEVVTKRRNPAHARN